MTTTATVTITTTHVRMDLYKGVSAFTALDTTTARAIVAMMRREVPFRIGVGARCPLCGTYAGTKSGAKNGVRYHSCNECGLNFKSILAK